jgi:hypothetical protein
MQLSDLHNESNCLDAGFGWGTAKPTNGGVPRRSGKFLYRNDLFVAWRVRERELCDQHSGDPRVRSRRKEQVQDLKAELAVHR